MSHLIQNGSRERKTLRYLENWSRSIDMSQTRARANESAQRRMRSASCEALLYKFILVMPNALLPAEWTKETGALRQKGLRNKWNWSSSSNDDFFPCLTTTLTGRNKLCTNRKMSGVTVHIRVTLGSENFNSTFLKTFPEC